jgi:hypothetical protein
MTTFHPSAAWFLCATLVACSSSSRLGDPSGAAGASGTPLTFPLDGAAGASANGYDSGPPTEDANCGTSARTMTQVPADLLLVLDRSGSMTSDIATDNLCDVTSGTCQERWATMMAAMKTVLAKAPASIHWGLKFFSTPSVTTALGDTPMGCVVLPAAEVPIGTGNANDIVGTIASTTPNYNTPTRAAIETATAYLSSLQDGRPKYILLATDGQPNCAQGGEYATSPDLAATLQAIAAAYAAGIKVHVIGVGPSAGNLDAMAEQGGTGNYYPALSPETLSAALDSIVGAVTSCVYTMSPTPPDPSNLGVYLDKQLVPQSASDGWTLGSGNSVVFHGPTCDGIKAGRYGNVQVLFGCPGWSVPQVIP